jgi:hypothetical protein
MAAGKQYKNVYTILEKVKKGEIDSYYKNDAGLFGKINFYKKPDLIKPHMHYIDERRLENIMDAHLFDTNKIKEGYEKFTKSTGFKKLQDDQKPDFNAYVNKFKENYRNFPKHMPRDIFKMYYNQIDKLDFEERDEKNYTKYKFLERANNPVGKIMSEHSSLKSAIYARNIMSYFINRLTVMDYVDAQKSEDIKNGLDGQSEFDNDSVDKSLDKMLDNKEAKDQLDKAMQDAQDLCKEMDQNIDNETQEKMFDAANRDGGSEAGKLSPDYIRKIAAKLENITFSMGAFKEKIKKLLDKSTSYFSANTKTIHEDIFNSDNIAGLDEYEMLHPKLRKIFMEDVTIKDTKSVGKIDVYIDISGSMSSSCSKDNEETRHISKIDFAKSLTAKLKQMDMLNNVYLFNNRVHECKNTIIAIAMIDTDGGTDIDKAVRKIEQNNVNALVITDAEDHCSIYSDKAFFIGVEGARFHGFSNTAIEKYSNRGQVVVFDGKTIMKVDSKGYIVTDKKKK